MALVKQETADQFFAQPEATTRSDVIENSVRRGFWSIARHIWTAAQVVSVCLTFAALGERMGLRFPIALVRPLPDVPQDSISHCPDISQPFLDTITYRVKILESQASAYAERARSFRASEHNTDSDVVNLSSRITAYETRLDAIDAFVEGSRPRSFSKAGDGARPIQALTSISSGSSVGLFQQLSAVGPFRRLGGGSRDINNPSLVLDDSAGLFCWETQSSPAQVGIRLSEPARITMFSITHPHPRTLLSRSMAKTPRTLTLWGLYPNVSTLPTPSGLLLRPASDFLARSPLPEDFPLDSYFIRLANGSYDPLLPSRRQYFSVSPSVLSLLTLPIRVVVVEVLDNWGANSTCLYGIGIHDEI